MLIGDKGGWSENKMDIQQAITTFYTLEDILWRSSPLDYSRAPKKLKEDIKAYQDHFEKSVAKVLFDYLALASFGEVRHAYDKGAWEVPELSTSGSRDKMYNHTAKLYDPQQALPNIAKAFNTIWEDGFGGPAWSAIAVGAGYYFKYPLKIFIDHVVDLSHNGGLAFDKGILLYLANEGDYKLLLDVKCHYSIIDVPIFKEVTAPCYSFLRRAANLYMFREHKMEYFWFDEEFMFPKAVKWGHKKVSKPEPTFNGIYDDYRNQGGSRNEPQTWTEINKQ